MLKACADLAFHGSPSRCLVPHLFLHPGWDMRQSPLFSVHPANIIFKHVSFFRKCKHEGKKMNGLFILRTQFHPGIILIYLCHAAGQTVETCLEPIRIGNTRQFVSFLILRNYHFSVRSDYSLSNTNTVPKIHSPTRFNWTRLCYGAGVGYGTPIKADSPTQIC